MTLVFIPGMPLASDIVASSQGQFLNNNGSLDGVFDVDHYKFSNDTDDLRGKHRAVHLPFQASATTIASEGAIFCNLDVLYFQPSNNGPPVAIGSGGGTSGIVLQTVFASTSAYTAVNTSIPTNAIPTNAQGQLILSGTITPKSATSKLLITCTVNYQAPSVIDFVMALFRDATANAIGANSSLISSPSQGGAMTWIIMVSSNASVSTTFNLRVGSTTSAGLFINGNSSGTIFGGGFQLSTMIIQEISA